jgi:membrane-associated protein
MHDFIEFVKSCYNAERLLAMVRSLLSNPIGMAGLFAIVFAETGLLVGFFLPGDSLLFSVGVASGATEYNVFLIAAMLMCAAIIGDNVGYFLGYHAGPRIFNRPKSKLFHPDHLRQTQEFYDRFGARAIVYARFVPIVRTCTPFIAGVARMRYTRFLLFSFFGGLFWIAFMLTVGYQLGRIPIVQRNFEKAVIGIIVLSLIPAVLEAFKKRQPA